MCATRWITHLGSAETAHEEIAGRLLSHDCTHRRVLFTEDLHVHWEDDLNVTSKVMPHTEGGGPVKGIGVAGQATEARTDMYDVSATCAHDLLI